MFQKSRHVTAAGLLSVALLLTQATNTFAQCGYSNRTVFSAARTSPLISASNPVRYDVILVDTAAGFNTDKTTYTVQSPGVYLIHMSAGVPPYQRLNYFLQGGTSTPNLVLNHTTFDGELVTSRDDIQFLGEGQTLYVSSNYPLYSDAMMQTSLSGFRLDNMMSRLIVFRAARTSPQYNTGRIVLDKLLINIGGGWDECNNQFVAPTTGIYFLSWSASNSPSKGHITYLNVNGVNFTENIILSGSYPGSDTTTQSLMLALNAGDVVYLIVQVYTPELTTVPIYSDSNYQTSFVGFLYEPISLRPIAWTLALRSTSLNGPAIVNFTDVILNEGSVWDATAATLKIPQTGVYYLKISGVSYNPAPNQYKFNLGLIVNGGLLTNTIEQSDTVKTEAFNLRGRALITQLQAGDVVEVGVPAGYNVFSNGMRQTIFSGFLIA